MAEAASVEIVIDPKVNLAAKAPINLAVMDMSVGSALRHVMRMGGLRGTLREGALHLFEPSSASDYADPRTYPVGDLLAPGAGAGPDALVTLIKTVVTPDQWGVAAGIEVKDGVLAVRQSPEAHTEIAALLAALRLMRQVPPSQPKTAAEPAGSRP